MTVTKRQVDGIREEERVFSGSSPASWANVRTLLAYIEQLEDEAKKKREVSLAVLLPIVEDVCNTTKIRKYHVDWGEGIEEDKKDIKKLGGYDNFGMFSIFGGDDYHPWVLLKDLEAIKVTIP